MNKIAAIANELKDQHKIMIKIDPVYKTIIININGENLASLTADETTGLCAVLRSAVSSSGISVLSR